MMMMVVTMVDGALGGGQGEAPCVFAPSSGGEKTKAVFSWAFTLERARIMG